MSAAETPATKETPAERPVTGEETVPRRRVVRAVGGVALTLAVVGGGAVSYRAYDNRVVGADSGSAFDVWRTWRDEPGLRGLVAAAVLAASPHNTQPWMFHLNADRVEVYVDPARSIGSADPYSREMYVGIGCALENLALAARARGLEPLIAPLPDPGRPLLAARVDLAPGPPQTSVLYDAIADRHTNRGPYLETPVPDKVLAELAALTTDSQVSLTWVTRRPDKEALGALMVEAAQAVADDPEQSRDGFAWFRGHAGDIEAHKDGLTLDGQGLSPLVTAIAKLLPASSRESGDAFWIDQTRTVHTATAAAYGFVLVSDPRDPRQQLAGGRVLQRIHLSVTARGLALQHMNQITERIDRDASLNRTPVLAPRLAALSGKPDRQVLATFRLGYPVRPGRRSPRRSVTDVLR